MPMELHRSGWARNDTDEESKRLGKSDITPGTDAQTVVRSASECDIDLPLHSTSDSRQSEILCFESLIPHATWQAQRHFVRVRNSPHQFPRQPFRPRYPLTPILSSRTRAKTTDLTSSRPDADEPRSNCGTRGGPVPTPMYLAKAYNHLSIRKRNAK